MGPGHGGKPGLGSMGSLQEEDTVFLLENALQFSRLRYVLSWPALMKLKRTLDQENKLIFALKVRCL